MLYTFPLFRLLLWRLSNVSTKKSGINTNNSHVIVFTFPFPSVGCSLWCLLHTSCSKQDCVMVLESKLHVQSWNFLFFDCLSPVLYHWFYKHMQHTQSTAKSHTLIYLPIPFLDFFVRVSSSYAGSITMHCIQERMLTDREVPRPTSAVHTHMRLMSVTPFLFLGVLFIVVPWARVD